MPRQKKVKLIGLGVPANLLKEFIDLSYKGNTSISPEGYSIDAPLSDSRVKVYTKNNTNDKEVIVVHRGSVGLQDWLDNAKFLVAGKVKSTKTYKMHRERHLKAIEKYGAENIIGIGHSRAGLYLQELQKEVPIKEIITYNKAVGFYDALRTNPAEQTDVKVKNDFVSLLSGLQKRPKKMVEIEATKNPLDFNAAHQPAELEKLGETFIGLENEPMEGSGRAPSPKTLEQLKKILKTLEGKLEKINKGKVYKTTNKDKVEYDISYTKARIKNHETKGEDLIITKKKKYKNELPAKAKAYKAKPKKEPKMIVKELEPKKEEPKKEEPKPEPKKEEPKKEEPRQNKMKKEEPKPEPSKYKFANILGEVNSPTFPIVVYQSKELKSWIDWLEKLIEKQKKKDAKIRRTDIFFTPESKQLLNELFEFLTIDRGGSVKVSILFIDDNIEELLKYLGFDNSFAGLPEYSKSLNAKNAKKLGEAYGQSYKAFTEELKKKEEPKKEEPKEEPKKEEPKPKKEKSQKQKDFAERQKNSALLLKIIEKGNKNIVKRLYDELITDKNDRLNEIMKKYIDGKGAEKDPNTDRTINSDVYDILNRYAVEFIEKYNKYMEEPKPVLELPTPEPTPKKIEPLINKLESKIKEFEALGKKHGAVIYNGDGFAQVVAYIALLVEYEAKCAIIGGKNLTNYTINSKLDNDTNTFFYSKAEKLSNDLLDCINRGDKLIAIPLSLRFGDLTNGHANLLIYRPYENTIERFEPYGELPDISADKTFNIVLKRMFEVEMKPYLKELTPKFIEPNQVCPNIKGFQALEEELGLLEQEGGGFCAMWSLFILELIFLNPTLSTKEIIQQGLTLSKSKPQYLRNVIRGYVLKIEKMLDSYVKKIGLNDGFNFKTTNNLKDSSFLFQEQLLNLLLSFGGSNSNIKELEESVKLQKLLSTKTNLEINNMAKSIFKSDFGVHNYKKWTAKDMINYIMREYLIPDTPKYKPKYVDEIFKYFEEPKKEEPKPAPTPKKEDPEKEEPKKQTKKDMEEYFRKYPIDYLKKFYNGLVQDEKNRGVKGPFKRAGNLTEDELIEFIVRVVILYKENNFFKGKKMEGGIFGWSDKEKADKAERKMLREEYYKTHNKQQNANYTFDKSARDKWKKEFYAKNTAPKAKEIVEVPKVEEVIETEPNMEGSGYRKSYIEEIANPVNPMFAFKSALSVPMFIEPENEYLIIDENYYGGSAQDMLGMNCYDGKCFNPVWEKEKIKRQILSEYKIWYWPWGTPPAGHIRMPWLNAMVEERYKPLYDEFVARRNVNIGLDANASKDDFGRQMFSNLTDALSYVPVLNLPTTIGLSVASAVSDIKKEPVEPIEPEPIEPDEIDTD